MSREEEAAGAIKAVLFDLGGVVLDSPFYNLFQLEQRVKLPKGSLQQVLGFGGITGPFQRMERGEISPERFTAEIDSVLKDAGIPSVSGKELFACMRNSWPRPVFLEAIKLIRAAGFKTAAITNDFAGVDKYLQESGLAQLFDVTIHSSKEGVRKPSRRIYEIAVERLAVKAAQCVYLDDIASNLKEPKSMGMITILVDMIDFEKALVELGSIIGLSLLASTKANL